MVVCDLMIWQYLTFNFDAFKHKQGWKINFLYIQFRSVNYLQEYDQKLWVKLGCILRIFDFVH